MSARQQCTAIINPEGNHVRGIYPNHMALMSRDPAIWGEHCFTPFGTPDGTTDNPRHRHHSFEQMADIWGRPVDEALYSLDCEDALLDGFSVVEVEEGFAVGLTDFFITEDEEFCEEDQFDFYPLELIDLFEEEEVYAEPEHNNEPFFDSSVDETDDEALAVRTVIWSQEREPMSFVSDPRDNFEVRRGIRELQRYGSRNDNGRHVEHRRAMQPIAG